MERDGEGYEYDDDHVFDYMDEGDEPNPADECGYIPGEGICMLAGTEHCDWDCPFNPTDATT